MGEGYLIAQGYAAGIACMAFYSAITPRPFTRKQHWCFAFLGLALLGVTLWPV